MTPGDRIERIFRREHVRVMASLARALRDIHRAEDALQEAWLVALERWPRDGVPEHPAAWMLTVARRRAIDALRREAASAHKLELLARLEPVAAEPEAQAFLERPAVIDEMLGLIFACAHPSLHVETRVPLVLRAVAGLSTDEIARAFLVPVPTMAQRLVRAKRKIRDAGIALEAPDAAHLHERLDAVCATIYVIFSEGYAASSGEARVRADLCNEAIRLGRVLQRLMPAEPEVAGLLALMLLQHSRSAARTDDGGNAVTLEEQDRSRWDRRAIAEGLGMLDRARAGGREGPYQLQAAIAAEHATAASAELTDWDAIARLYARLAELAPSPVVRLNEAVAIAMSQGPAQGLARIEEVAAAGSLERYPWLHAARADLLRRLGRNEDAAAAYGRALDLVGNQTERRFFERRIAELASP